MYHMCDDDNSKNRYITFFLTENIVIFTAKTQPPQSSVTVNWTTKSGVADLMMAIQGAVINRNCRFSILNRYGKIFF